MGLSRQRLCASEAALLYAEAEESRLRRQESARAASIQSILTVERAFASTLSAHNGQTISAAESRMVPV